ncbi:MAG: hypothetical protein ACNS62_12635 [Candidatus Cyclobacteriaceae bacterium M3_2C_046]
MKSVFSLTLGLFLFFECYSQVSLPLNQDKKVEFYDVIDFAGTQTEIYDKVLYVVKNIDRCQIIDSVRGEVSSVDASCEFPLYKTKFTKSLDGQMEYKFKVEVKDNRYRYFLNDFVFQPYKRDRYGRYQAVKGQAKPLEEQDYKGNQNKWENYKDLTEEYMMALAGYLKEEVEQTHIGNTEDNKTSKRDW